MIKRKIYIGTSGWIYSDWAGKFFPINLKQEKLAFYSKSFNTVEVNYSFYRLPSKKTFKHWFDLTPKDFKFSVKISRYISHTKKLKVDDRGQLAINRFLNNAVALKDKVAVILVQLPSNFKINLERLDKFLDYTAKQIKKKKLKTKIAVEFRHESWLNQEVYQILKKYNSAIVISHSPEYPLAKALTADFAYLRFHGPTWLYSSKYTDSELKTWAKEIKSFNSKIKEVFIYFNNDAFGYAIDNAKYLKKIVEV